MIGYLLDLATRCEDWRKQRQTMTSAQVAFCRLWWTLQGDRIKLHDDRARYLLLEDADIPPFPYTRADFVDTNSYDDYINHWCLYRRTGRSYIREWLRGRA